ncbi:hypothetical protein GCM10017786_73500 [Amycolatopsis deserti]|uniref:Uncharacterized protein n=1 Tax=Amycolatopsis deserti TaxID=185696 RepID=A0ABQ3JJL9_9PSEU|nr:hypothetical protein GCM10017786_73500 [Amycolatopsis deserti]
MQRQQGLLVGLRADGVAGQRDVGLDQAPFTAGGVEQVVHGPLGGAGQRFERDHTAGVEAVERLEGEPDWAHGPIFAGEVGELKEMSTDVHLGGG